MSANDGTFISDFTKKTLMQFGWSDGDQIPDNLGDLLLAAKDRATTISNRKDVMVDIETLREEDVEKIKTALDFSKKAGLRKEKEEALEAQTKNMSPEVAAFYKQLNDKEIDDAGPSVIDDREEEATKQEAPPTQEEPPPQKEPDPFPTDLPPIILPFCPRCGWDMRQKFDIEITDQDKEAFLAILLGNTRFKKNYSLLNDKYVVTFRSLLADENNLIHRQLVLDHEDKQFMTEAEWFLRLFEYRLACSVESVFTGDGKPMSIIPELQQVKYTPPEDKPLETPLVFLREYVNTKVLAHEVTRRLVSQQLRQFQRLVEALEAMALEPSFWDGIG